MTASVQYSASGEGSSPWPERVRGRVIARLLEFTPARTAMTGQLHIVRDLDIDPAGVEELIGALEDDFGIDMPLARVAGVETVDDLVATVVALTRAPPT